MLLGMRTITALRCVIYQGVMSQRVMMALRECTVAECRRAPPETSRDPHRRYNPTRIFKI